MTTNQNEAVAMLVEEAKRAVVYMRATETSDGKLFAYFRETVDRLNAAIEGVTAPSAPPPTVTASMSYIAGDRVSEDDAFRALDNFELPTAGDRVEHVVKIWRKYEGA